MLLFAPNFENYFDIIDFQREISKFDDLTIDFSKLGFAYPQQMVLLARVISDHRRRGGRITPINFQRQSYPLNMGFFEAAGFAMPPHPVAAGNANYFPITVLKTKDIARQAISFGQHHGEVLQALVSDPKLRWVISAG